MKSTAPLLRALLPPLRPLFGADPHAAALRTYQSVACASGVLLVAGAAVFARATLPSRRDRALFVALVATSGPMLLFFGYVENYAPFAALTGVTCFTAVAALEGRIRRAWVLVPAIPAIAAHAFGPLLLPAVAWVFLAETPAARRWGAAPRALRWSALAAAAAAAAAGLVQGCERSMAVRLAVLPVPRTWYTLEGYTLFSRNHLLDLANLALQALPGLVVLAAACAVLRPRVSPRPAVRTFFALVLGFPWLGVFLLAPAIGMPRDWDLFAFAAVPLAAFAGLALLRESKDAAAGRRAAVMIAALGLAVTGARVAEGVAPEVAVRRAQANIALDKSRSRAARSILITYFANSGQYERADEESRRYEADFPERALERRAHELLAEGRTAEAMQVCREALALNSGSRDANLLLGEGLLATGEFEEAAEMLHRAYSIGADPLRSAHDSGLANAWLGRSAEAEAWWMKALEIRPDSYEVHLSLAKLYETQGRREEFVRHLGEAARSENAAPDVIARAKEVGAIAR